MLKPEEWRRIQEAASIDDRTMTLLMLGKRTSTNTQRRVQGAARLLGIALPRGLFPKSEETAA